MHQQHGQVLYHVQLLKTLCLTINTATNERGDYVGLDLTHNWHAIEAKGRSDGISDSLVEEAKSQASRIETVNGVAPVIHAACIADLSACPVTVLLVDPPLGGTPRKTLLIQDDGFAQFYYSNLVGFIEQHGERVRVDGLPEYSWAPLRAVDLPLPPFTLGLDLYIGLPTWIMAHPGQALERRGSERAVESPYVGMDHIALAGRMPDWDEFIDR
jgi:hypothetical protein